MSSKPLQNDATHLSSFNSPTPYSAITHYSQNVPVLSQFFSYSHCSHHHLQCPFPQHSRPCSKGLTTKKPLPYHLRQAKLMHAFSLLPNNLEHGESEHCFWSLPLVLGLAVSFTTYGPWAPVPISEVRTIIVPSSLGYDEIPGTGLNTDTQQ